MKKLWTKEQLRAFSEYVNAEWATELTSLSHVVN